MPTLPPIPEYLIPIIAIIVTPIAGWLNSNNLPKWFNRVISFAIAAIFAFICAYLTGSLSGDITVGFMAIAIYAYILIRGPLVFLHQWLLLKVPSPLGFLAPVSVTSRPTGKYPVYGDGRNDDYER